jgi:hypothetical protein
MFAKMCMIISSPSCLRAHRAAHLRRLLKCGSCLNRCSAVIARSKCTSQTPTGSPIPSFVVPHKRQLKRHGGIADPEALMLEVGDRSQRPRTQLSPTSIPCHRTAVTHLPSPPCRLFPSCQLFRMTRTPEPRKPDQVIKVKTGNLRDDVAAGFRWPRR